MLCVIVVVVKTFDVTSKRHPSKRAIESTWRTYSSRQESFEPGTMLGQVSSPTTGFRTLPRGFAGELPCENVSLLADLQQRVLIGEALPMQ